MKGDLHRARAGRPAQGESQVVTHLPDMFETQFVVGRKKDGRSVPAMRNWCGPSHPGTQK